MKYTEPCSSLTRRKRYQTFVFKLNVIQARMLPYSDKYHLAACGDVATVTNASGPVAQWIRHRPTEPGIAGSSPAGVIFALWALSVRAPRRANAGTGHPGASPASLHRHVQRRQQGRPDLLATTRAPPAHTCPPRPATRQEQFP